MLQPGFLLLNKPIGMRSSVCVEKTRKILGKGVKVGHGGTLDSTASGLLVLLIAGATRLSSLVMQMPKVYRATIKLGVSTTTCDYSGEPVFMSDASAIEPDDIDSILPGFLGWRMQLPPKVSAVHIDGRRAHEIYRNGDDPGIKPRPVFVEAIQRVSPLSGDGCFTLLVHCGKGTYIRSIARDIGQILGCGAHISALERERSGYFSLAESLSPSSEYFLKKEEILQAMLPITAMEKFLPSYSLPEEQMRRLANGLNARFADAERHSFGTMPPKDTLMFFFQSTISLAHAEKNTDGLYYILPEVNINTEGFR